jgi:hypothetical protein
LVWVDKEARRKHGPERIPKKEEPRRAAGLFRGG